MEFTCVALDFDGCLAYYEGGLTALLKVFIDGNYPAELVQSTFEEITDSVGLSFGNMINALEQKTHTGVDRLALAKVFDEWLASSVKLFPDVHSFLVRTKSLGLPMAVITRGDDAYQMKKVQITGIEYDHIFITKELGGKHVAIEKLLDVYGPQVAFVDDRAEELDGVRANLSKDKVETFRIRRQGGRHAESEARFDHVEIAGLEEILV